LRRVHHSTIAQTEQFSARHPSILDRRETRVCAVPNRGRTRARKATCASNVGNRRAIKKKHHAPGGLRKRRCQHGDSVSARKVVAAIIANAGNASACVSDRPMPSLIAPPSADRRQTARESRVLISSLPHRLLRRTRANSRPRRTLRFEHFRRGDCAPSPPGFARTATGVIL
jgi:hypothetical protein